MRLWSREMTHDAIETHRAHDAESHRQLRNVLVRKLERLCGVSPGRSRVQHRAVELEVRKFLSARHLAPGQLVLSPSELDELQQDVAGSVDAVAAHEKKAAAAKAKREAALAAARLPRPQTSPDGGDAELVASLSGMHMMGLERARGGGGESSDEGGGKKKDGFDGLNQWMLMDHIQTLKHERDQHKRELKKKRTRKAMRDFYDKQVNDKRAREKNEHNDWAKYLSEVDTQVKQYHVEEVEKARMTKQRNADHNRVVMQQLKESRRKKEDKKKAAKTFEGEGIAIRGPSLIEKIGTLLPEMKGAAAFLPSSFLVSSCNREIAIADLTCF